MPNPCHGALGFAALVLVVEGVALADVTPRQMAGFLAGVSEGEWGAGGRGGGVVVVGEEGVGTA